MSEQVRSRARTREGVVVSAAMDKTIVVSVKRKIKHAQYKKYINVSKRYVAHDETNQCAVGDRVVIRESRPLSKHKRWRLRAVVDKAIEDVAGVGSTP